MNHRDTQIYWAARSCLYTSLQLFGINSVVRRKHRDRLLVLTYHDILPPGFDRTNPLYGMTVSTQNFEQQLQWVARKYKVVTLPEVIEWVRGKCELPPNSALITFDDGHRNNLAHAAPILSKLGISAVFFVLSDFIGECRMAWVEEAYARLLWGEADRIELRQLNLPLNAPKDRVEACGRFFDLCRTLQASEIDTVIAELREKLPLEFYASAMAERFQFLKEGDIEELAKMGFEIGSHGKSHRILRTLPDELMEKELSESKEKLESVTRRPVRALAYPFGDPKFDFSSREAQMAEKCGYEIAFSAGPGLAQRKDSRFVLPRIGVGAGLDSREFEAFTAGTIASIKNLVAK